MRIYFFCCCFFLLTASTQAVTWSINQSLRVAATDVIMRAAPWRGATVLQTLQEYDHVVFLGDYTVEPETITIRGDSVTAPFVRVRSDDGQEGWVFAGLVTDDDEADLLARKLPLIVIGAELDEITRIYGRQVVEHDRRMRNPVSDQILDRLSTNLAFEYFYFRTGQGVVFGIADDQVAAIKVRQDEMTVQGVVSFWRTVDGFMNHPLRQECYALTLPPSCSDYVP